MEMESEREFVLAGPKLEVPLKEKSLGEYIFRNMKKHPMDKMMQVIVDTGEKITFGEMCRLSMQICQGLINEGLKRGDVVSIVGGNSTHSHASFLGILWAAGVPHVVVQDLRLGEMQAVFQQSQPKWVFCEPRTMETVTQSLKHLKINAKIIMMSALANFCEKYARVEDILPEVDENSFAVRLVESPTDIALILSSSGTTGVPKAVGLTHQNVLSQMPLWEFLSPINIIRPLLCTSEFSWITGSYFLILACVYGSFRAITTSVNPASILNTLQDYKLESAMISPVMINTILKHPDFKKYDLSNLQEIYTGGSILSKHTAESFQSLWKGTKLYQLYGLTEMGGLVTMPHRNNIFSGGRPFFNVEIKIVDLETGKNLRPNMEGEIRIKSPGMFKTYVGNEKAAMEAITSDGWFCTGDIGYYSEGNEIFITSRIKEIFKYRNQQISPVELESFISSLPGIGDVAIVGIPEGDDSYTPMAVIVKAFGSGITASEIIKKVEENFSESKHLKAGVHFVDQLPRSVSGKLRRCELNEMAKKILQQKTSSLQ